MTRHAFRIIAALIIFSLPSLSCTSYDIGYNNNDYGNKENFYFEKNVNAPDWAKQIVGSYPDLEVNEPGQLMAGFASFNPPVETVTLTGNEPQIAELIKINNPGDTLPLTAENLEADSDFTVFGKGVLSNATVVKIEGQKAAITLPSSLPENEVYMMWSGNDAGFGKPVMINKAELWWIGPDKVEQGEEFSVYGANLVADRDNPVSYIYILELDRWLTSVSANPYKADFIAPTNLGSYTVWSHNGKGGKYGWSDKSVGVEVWEGFNWEIGVIRDVTNSQYAGGADGSDTVDDYAAIDAAIDAAQPGDTVYFPAGTYLISQSIETKSDMRLKGAGIDVTIIQNAPSKSGSYIFNNQDETKVEISNMTLKIKDQTGQKILHSRYSENIFVNYVKFSYLEAPNAAGSPLDFHTSKRVIIDNCDFFIDYGLEISHADNFIIRNTDFYGIYNSNTLINMKSTDGFAFENNTAQPYDHSLTDELYGWAKGRVISGTQVGGSPSKWYVGENVVTDMYPSDETDINSGEHFMYEGRRMVYTGYVASATENTAIFSDNSADLSRYVIAIVEGKGLGQTRRVESYNSGTAVLDRPWEVIPDSSSLVSISGETYKAAFYGNYQKGGFPSYQERNCGASPDDPRCNKASAGVQMNYYGGYNVLIDNNQFSELCSPVQIRGANEDGNLEPWPSYFNLFQNNDINTTRYGVWIQNDAYSKEYADGVDVPLFQFGNIIRRNTFDDIKDGVIIFRNNRDLPTPDTSLSDFLIFEDNNASNYEDAIETAEIKAFTNADMGVDNVFFINNNFESDGVKNY